MASVTNKSQLNSSELEVSSWESKFVEDNFTVDKWRNKIFTDIRVRSKLKDKNYRMKIIDDLELTKSYVIRELSKEKLNSLDEILAIGNDFVLFNAQYGKDQYCSERVVIKVSNKPSKKLMDSKKKFYEHDTDFLNLVQGADPSEFPNLWVQRHIKLSERLLGKGIKCPKPVDSFKNILLTRKIDEESLEQFLSNPEIHFKSIEAAFKSTISIHRHLYQNNGLVFREFHENSLSYLGTIFDVTYIIPKSEQGSQDYLWKTSQKIRELFKPRGIENSVESIFHDIAGFDYSQVKQIKPKLEDPQITIRKIERKSERSISNKNKLQADSKDQRCSAQSQNVWISLIKCSKLLEIE